MPARRSPFEDIEDVFERMSERFRPFEAELGAISVDVEDRDDEYVVTADVPGFDRDEIDVEVQEDMLHIHAERSEETEAEGEAAEAEEEEGEYLRSERTHRSMSRTIRLPHPVDESEAGATYQNGVLTVTIPKAEEERTGTSIPIE